MDILPKKVIWKKYHKQDQNMNNRLRTNTHKMSNKATINNNNIQKDSIN